MPHILVVDDDHPVRAAAARMLEIGGHTVTEATGGTDALHQMDQQMPDLVLSDVNMPEMDGYALCLLIRVHHPEIPFVAMSGHLNGDESALPFNGFLSKPFTMQRLLQTVENALTVLLT